jgi:hypothetical protein
MADVKQAAKGKPPGARTAQRGPLGEPERYPAHQEKGAAWVRENQALALITAFTLGVFIGVMQR